LCGQMTEGSLHPLTTLQYDVCVKPAGDIEWLMIDLSENRYIYIFVHLLIFLFVSFSPLSVYLSIYLSIYLCVR